MQRLVWFLSEESVFPSIWVQSAVTSWHCERRSPLSPLFPLQTSSLSSAMRISGALEQDTQTHNTLFHNPILPPSLSFSLSLFHSLFLFIFTRTVQIPCAPRCFSDHCRITMIILSLPLSISPKIESRQGEDSRSESL